MRCFVLNRRKDVTGVSGTGIIADGVEFPDGRCVLAWRGRYRSLEIHRSIHDVEAVHGHHGATCVEWETDMPVDTKQLLETIKEQQEEILERLDEVLEKLHELRPFETRGYDD